MAIVQEAGFDVSKADWLRHQAKQTLDLNDEELEKVAGGESDLESCSQFVSGGNGCAMALRIPLIMRTQKQ